MAFVVFKSRWFGFRFTFAHIPTILIEEQTGYRAKWKREYENKNETKIIVVAAFLPFSSSNVASA